jgi:hypothetical protein
MTLFKPDGPRPIVLIASVLAALVASVASAPAADLVKHSGRIVDFDPIRDTIVLAEVGPWQVRDGVTVVTYRTVALTPRTEFAIAFRTEDAEGLFAGEYIESPIERAAVYVDDYVTIECRHERA